METALVLFAAASGQDTDASRDMLDAIARGWSAGPVGVMAELEWIGLVPDTPAREAEATAEVEILTDQLRESDARIDELEREVADDDDTIEKLREEIAELRERLADQG